MPSFIFIGNTYGRNALQNFRKWGKFARREVSALEQLKFLHRCRDNDVLLKSIRSRPPVQSMFAKSICILNGRRMLKVLIQDAHDRLSRYISKSKEYMILFKSAITEEHFNIASHDIMESCQKAQNNKRKSMKSKLTRLINDSSNVESKSRVVNLSQRILSVEENDLLSYGLNLILTTPIM